MLEYLIYWLTCVQDNMVMQLKTKTTPISPKLLYQLRPWDLENVKTKEKSPVYITLKHCRQVLQVLFDAIFSTDYRRFMKGSFFPIHFSATVIGNKHQNNDWQKTRDVQTTCASYNCGLFVSTNRPVETGGLGGGAAAPPRLLLPCIFPELKIIVLKWKIA